MTVISGGQTGADQGGLLGARACGVKTGGVAPKGYETETGMATWLKDYGLTESDVSYYPTRTAINVRDCDVCLWFGDIGSRGGKLTSRLCKENYRPLIPADPERSDPAEIAARIRESAAKRESASVKLMVAGNRESVSPGIAEKVEEFMKRMLPILVNG